MPKSRKLKEDGLHIEGDGPGNQDPAAKLPRKCGLSRVGKTRSPKKRHIGWSRSSSSADLPEALGIASDNKDEKRTIGPPERETGDDLLRDHLETAPGNATYLSPQIQNEILVASSTLVQQTIVSQVNSAKCFSLLADETTDISGTEQMSVCVRYLLDDKLHEDFLAFVEVTNLSGQGLASTLMRLLRDKGVDATYLCGQGYDGAANMSGRLNGVQAVIQREHPAALYMHCASHSLNLALCCSCSVPESGTTRLAEAWEHLRSVACDGFCLEVAAVRQRRRLLA
ncbi:hypothetical protein ISCGN_001882 [Ixodes scapularis]